MLSVEVIPPTFVQLPASVRLDPFVSVAPRSFVQPVPVTERSELAPSMTTVPR